MSAFNAINSMYTEYSNYKIVATLVNKVELCNMNILFMLSVLHLMHTI